MKKSYFYVTIGIIVLLLITNVFTFTYFSNKIEQINVGIGLSTIDSVLDSSNNTLSIYEFTRYQYQQGAIDENSFSKTLQGLVNIHDKLISMTEVKVKTEKLQEINDLTTEMLKKRREGFSNLKSAIDLSSENFNNVAEINFIDSNNLKEQISEKLKVFAE